eukprot:SM000028S10058  [mRNA]  locus=s28:176043:176856:- [translate_table: standard]
MARDDTLQREGSPAFKLLRPGVDQRTRQGLIFVTGMAALGLGWFLLSYRPTASRLDPEGKINRLGLGKKVPTVPTEQDKDQIHHPEGPTHSAAVQPQQGGGVQGHSEASKPRIPSGGSISRDSS